MPRLKKKYIIFLFLFGFYFLLSGVIIDPIPKSSNPIINFSFKEAEKINVFKLLNKIDAFLVDIDLLGNYFGNTGNLHVDLATVDHLVFGVLIDSLDLETFKKLVNYKVVKDFAINISIENNKIVQKNVLNCIYLTSNELTIQISIFYSRGNFLWNGANKGSGEIKPIWFGDAPRAINRFHLKKVFINGIEVGVPVDWSQFSYEYRYSEFIECDHKLLLKNKLLLGQTYEQNETLNKMLLPPLLNVIKILENSKKHYWLAGGTLLGWFRDCGIIPHTNDADIFILYNEYEETFRKNLLGNPLTPLTVTFGLTNESFEMRTVAKGMQVDVFIAYEFNKTYLSVGYHQGRFTATRLIPNLKKFCSGDVLGHKMMVPCNPVEYLDLEYNPRTLWTVPIKKFMWWSNMLAKQYYWPEQRWPYAFKVYYRNGTIDKRRTINGINERYRKFERPIKDILFVDDVIQMIKY